MNILNKHQQRDLIIDILAAPERIRDAQVAFDALDREYQTHLTAFTVQAYGAALFPGKKDGDAPRPAANDDERRLAVEMTVNADPEFVKLAEQREAAQRLLQYERNRLESARLIVKLISDKD